MTQVNKGLAMAMLNWKNRSLFINDNIRILRGMNSETVDCIATDPPFNAKRMFNAPLGSQAAERQFSNRWRWDEVTDEWQDIIAADWPAIKEIIESAAVIEGGQVDGQTGAIRVGRVKNSLAAYLAYMAPRIVEMRRILKPRGVLFLQCNWEAGSYLRLMLDAVFGRNMLINEIIWKGTGPKGLARRRMPRNHGTIYAYGKTKEWKWNPPCYPYDMENLDEKTLRQYKKTDAEGRRYQLTSLTHKENVTLEYEFGGVTRRWRWTRDRMERARASGQIVQTSLGAVWRFKRYLDEQRGRPMDGIWLDVMQIDAADTAWATRKPISLYRRLIECGTDKGDVVLDPFGGCGTTMIAAELLGRRWVGIDIDLAAGRETKRRMRNECGLTKKNEEMKVIKGKLDRTDDPPMNDAKMRHTLYENQGRRCGNPYCDSRSLRKEDIQLDHRIPKSRGGADDITNRVGLCVNCNQRKGARSWGRFLNEDRERQPHPEIGEGRKGRIRR